LSTKLFRPTRPSKNHDFKPAEPYKVRKIINLKAYKLEVAKTMRNQKVFHISQLDQYTPSVVRQPPSERQPTIVDKPGDEEWEDRLIFDSKQR
jgi:hypothetical protein